MLSNTRSQKLERLNRFHDCGALSDEEFEREVARLTTLFSDPHEPDPDPGPDPNDPLPEPEEKPA